MTREQNVRAILECVFSQSKEDLIDIAVKGIMTLRDNPCSKGTTVTDLKEKIKEHSIKDINGCYYASTGIVLDIIDQYWDGKDK